MFVAFNARISSDDVHFLMLFNLCIRDGVLVKLKVLEYTLVDLIGYNHLGVASVDIHWRPQFTFFLIVLVRTQPELPLASPLILWCLKHQKMFFV